MPTGVRYFKTSVLSYEKLPNFDPEAFDRGFTMNLPRIGYLSAIGCFIQTKTHPHW